MRRDNRGFLLLEVLIAVALAAVFTPVAFRGILAGRRMEKDAAVEERLLMAAKQRMEEAKGCAFSSLVGAAEEEADGTLHIRQEPEPGYVMETTLDPVIYRNTEGEAAVFRCNGVGTPRLADVEVPENFVLRPENFCDLDEETDLFLRVEERGGWLTTEVSVRRLAETENEEDENEEEKGGKDDEKDRELGKEILYSGSRRICLEETKKRAENRVYLFFPEEAIPGAIYVEGNPGHEVEVYFIFGEEGLEMDCLWLNGFPAKSERVMERLKLYTNLDDALPVAEEAARDHMYQITVAVYETGDGGGKKEVLTLHGCREAE